VTVQRTRQHSRELRDRVRDATTSLAGEQRRLLAELLDEIDVGVRVAARVVEQHPSEPGTHRLTAASCWDDTVARYSALLAAAGNAS
jgi:hypothetical protein